MVITHSRNEVLLSGSPLPIAHLIKRHLRTRSISHDPREDQDEEL